MRIMKVSRNGITRYIRPWDFDPDTDVVISIPSPEEVRSELKTVGGDIKWKKSINSKKSSKSIGAKIKEIMNSLGKILFK